MKNDMTVAIPEGQKPSDMIRLAVDKGTDLSKLRELLEIQKDWEANEARKAYNKALSIVHSKMPAVAKTLTNPQTRSKYASLDSIINHTKSIYTANGFSVCFYEGVSSSPNCVRVCADLIHELGHKESYFYDVPLDGVGIKGNANMTAIHGKASSVSYGRRYLMCMVFNIPTGDDNDGNANSETIDHKQLNQLLDLVAEKGVDIAKFCNYLNVDQLENLPKTQFEKAMEALKAKVKK